MCLFFWSTSSAMVFFSYQLASTGSSFRPSTRTWSFAQPTHIFWVFYRPALFKFHLFLYQRGSSTSSTMVLFLSTLAPIPEFLLFIHQFQVLQWRKTEQSPTLFPSTSGNIRGCYRVRAPLARRRFFVAPVAPYRIVMYSTLSLVYLCSSHSPWPGG